MEISGHLEWRMHFLEWYILFRNGIFTFSVTYEQFHYNITMKFSKDVNLTNNVEAEIVLGSFT